MNINYYKIINSESLDEIINENKNKLIIIFIFNEKNNIINEYIKKHISLIYSDCMYIYINKQQYENKNGRIDVNKIQNNSYICFIYNNKVIDEIKDEIDIKNITYYISYIYFMVNNEINMVINEKIESIDKMQYMKFIKLLKEIIE
jgi:hypothetical protein